MIKPLPNWTLTCDFPDCAADLFENADYQGMLSIEHLLDHARDVSWWFGLNQSDHFCDAHPVFYPEDKYPPETPYLLLHGESADQPWAEGFVTLIQTPAPRHALSFLVRVD